MKTIHLKQTDSTNLYLERHLKELPEICSVRADIQTAGKGRLSRQWDSAKGGLWFSVLFKSPTLSPFHLQKVCSLATLKTLNNQLELGGKRNLPNQKSPPTGGCPRRGWGGSKQINVKETLNNSPEKFSPSANKSTSSKKSYNSIRMKPNNLLLKWPNDIYYNSRKISGCLQKNILSSTGINCIIGIGININNPLPDELSQKAINLKTILSKEIDVEQLYYHILENIEQRLSNFSLEELEADYRNNQLIKNGVFVKVLDMVNNNHYSGRVIGYPGETLEIFTEDGLQLSFKAADVTLKSWDN